MGRIWTVLLLADCGWALVGGRGEAAGAALTFCGREAVELTLTLAGSMALWSGLAAILEETGDVARLGRLLRRLLRPLFPGLTDEACWEAMSFNLAANAAGLGNAATPAGVRAASLLAAQGETGLRSLAMLLVLNNSSLQVIPGTVLSLRAAAGSADPSDIWLPAMAASAAATVTAALLMTLLGGRGKHGGGHPDRADRTARRTGRR